MAIINTVAGTTPTTVYTSNGDSAVTFISFCNTSALPVQMTLYIVPNGNSPGDDNTVIAELEIQSKNTYEFYHGAEKIILSNGDFIAVMASDINAITTVVSYTGL